MGLFSCFGPSACQATETKQNEKSCKGMKREENPDPPELGKGWGQGGPEQPVLAPIFVEELGPLSLTLGVVWLKGEGKGV